MLALLLAVLALRLLVGIRERESLVTPPATSVHEWAEEQRLPPAAVPGARLFAETGCLACHTYTGAGSANLGAPDLTREGRRGRGVAWRIRHLACPRCVGPDSAMPSFDALGRTKLRRLAVFLEASKGRR